MEVTFIKPLGNYRKGKNYILPFAHAEYFIKFGIAEAYEKPEPVKTKPVTKAKPETSKKEKEVEKEVVIEESKESDKKTYETKVLTAEK